MRSWTVVMAVLLSASALAGEREDELLKAVRKGDAAAVKVLLDAGVSPNAKYRYDRSILSFAADRGNREIVEVLLARGAEVNAKDTFYGTTPLVSAVQAGHVEVVRLLLAKGAEPAADAFTVGLEKDNVDLVKVVAASGKVTPEHLGAALAWSGRAGKTALADVLRGLGAQALPALAFTPDPAVLARYAGAYRSDRGSVLRLEVIDGVLQLPQPGFPPMLMEPADATTFRVVDIDGVSQVVFEVDGTTVKAFTLKQPGAPERRFARAEDVK